MKIIGGLLIAFGLADFGGSWAGIDVWRDWFGIVLPEILWRFSAYAEIGIGYFCFNLGSSPEAESSEELAPAAEPGTTAEADPPAEE
ncbi:MAG: hypothetical protein VB858_17640 [Planctomycetaceae bacterium]